MSKNLIGLTKSNKNSYLKSAKSVIAAQERKMAGQSVAKKPTWFYIFLMKMCLGQLKYDAFMEISCLLCLDIKVCPNLVWVLITKLIKNEPNIVVPPLKRVPSLNGVKYKNGKMPMF